MNPALIVDLSLFACATLFFVAGFALARSLRLRQFEQRAVGDLALREREGVALLQVNQELTRQRAHLEQQLEDSRKKLQKLLQVTRELDLFRDIQDQMSHLSGEKQDSVFPCHEPAGQ